LEANEGEIRRVLVFGYIESNSIDVDLFSPADDRCLIGFLDWGEGKRSKWKPL